MDVAQQTHFRACHLCEAICGLEIITKGDQVISIKGDRQDPISRGYICPKATAISDIHTDPDRIRKPIKRIGEKWIEISWDEALQTTANKLVNIQKQHGDNAIGFYAGNPNVHNYGNLTHGPLLRRAVGSRNNFSATSLDQLPHHLSSYAMYGHQFFIPVPDIERTQLMVIFGGNPLVSNGSIMTMPDTPKRFKALQARGGKLVVIDPRRTETANIADQHHFIRPGKDAFVLLAIINTLFNENWINTSHLDQHLENVSEVKLASTNFTLKLAEAQSGIPQNEIKELAYQLSAIEKSVCYGRMGVSVQEFGGLCQWAIQVINILTGSLDKEGGTLLTSPAFAYVEKGLAGAGHFNLFQSRVSGLPEFSGELPAVAMAEEILTPCSKLENGEKIEGDDQIKAMVTIAGNPVIASANSSELETAFDSLEFCVAIDFYINATTRHADIILPPTSPLEHDNYDIAFLRFAIHNSSRYNPAVFQADKNALHDWQIYNKLSALINELKGKPFKPLPAPDLLIAQGIEHGFFGASRNLERSLTLDKIKAYPHGLDLGPLETGLVNRICTANGKINCAPSIFINDIPRLKAKSSKVNHGELLLIGRRHVRSNNSWMHNYHRLVKGKPRWQLMMHPQDLNDRGLTDNSRVTITSKVGSVVTTVMATEELMPGVVSLPHGWGHNKKGVQMSIATKQQGVNCNELTDTKLIDQLCGNAALNGVPVTVSNAT